VQRTQLQDFGFTPAGVTMFSVGLPPSDYDDRRARRFYVELLERLRGISPGASIGLAALPPLGAVRKMTDVSLPGVADVPRALVPFQPVSAEYFEALRIPIRAGGVFTPSDSAAGGIVVNAAMARRYWPGGNAVGQVIVNGGRRREVLGVVGDARVYDVGSVEPMFFSQFFGATNAVLLVRASGGRGGDIAKTVQQTEARAIVTSGTLEEQIDQALSGARSIANLAGSLGLLGLLLATIGVYGVIAYSVLQRRREIGVRLAVGATPRQVVGFVLRSNARPVLIGLGAGGGLSLLGARLLSNRMPGVTPFDGVVWAGVLALLLLCGISASIAPAHRAARLDPLSVLRLD